MSCNKPSSLSSMLGHFSLDKQTAENVFSASQTLKVWVQVNERRHSWLKFDSLHVVTSSCSCLILLLECFCVHLLRPPQQADIIPHSALSISVVYFCGTSLMRSIASDYLIPPGSPSAWWWCLLLCKPVGMFTSGFRARVQWVPNASWGK